MKNKLLYWLILILILVAWFAHSPIDRVVSTKDQPKTPSISSKVSKDASLFGIKEQQWVNGGQCNIERINGELMGTSESNISREKPLLLSGWAMDTAKSKLPDSVIIHFEGIDNISYFAKATSGISRSDVRDYFHLTDNLLLVGYETNINLKMLPNGHYTLSVLMKYNNTIYNCDIGRKIIVN